MSKIKLADLFNATTLATKIGFHCKTYVTLSAYDRFAGLSESKLETFLRSAYVSVLNAMLSGKTSGKFIAEESTSTDNFREAGFVINKVRGGETILVLTSGGEL